MKLVTRLTIAMCALVLFTAVTMAAVVYRTLLDAYAERELATLAESAGAILDILEDEIAEASADAIAVSRGPSAEAIAAGAEGAALEAWRRTIGANLMAVLSAEPNYLQFRLIGVAANGREIVRADRSGPDGAVRLTRDSELQAKGDRAYFAASVALEPGQVFVSPIELNQEFGQIEPGNQPVLRVGTPVRDATGRAFGAVIINLDMRAVLGEMRAAAPAGTQLLVVDGEGQYLVGPTPEHDFGHELGRPGNLRDLFPGLASLEPAALHLSDAAGDDTALAIRTAELSGGKRVAVILSQPFDLLATRGGSPFLVLLPALLLAIAAATGAAFLTARSLARPITAMARAVSGYPGEGVLRLGDGAKDEIGLLGRAVSDMTARLSEGAAALRRESDELRAATGRAEAHAARERLFREAMESASDCIIILDNEGRVLTWSAAATRLYGWSAAEMLGATLERLAPADRTDEIEASLRRIRAGERVDGLVTVRQRKDGSRFDAAVAISPVHDPEGRLIGACKIVRDVTLAMREADRLRNVVQASPSGMILVDAGDRLVMANAEACRMFGYPEDGLVGTSLDALIPAPRRAGHAALRAAYLAEPEARHMGVGRDLSGLHADGTEFPLEVGLTPIETREGQMVLAVVVDISSRKAAERKIEEANEALVRSNTELEQFAYIAAHDLQEPLRMVASYSELLAERYRGRLDERADRYIGYTIDGARRMKQLITDLLAYSRVQTRSEPFRDLDLAKVARDVATELDVLISEGGAEVVIGDLPEVLGDESQLRQVLGNLVGNAVKFRSDRPARIEVSARREDGGMWRISVADNGIGIDPQYFDRIFQMFQRLHERSRYEGSGIGLAISRKIVERHGGRIWVESTPGEGATFHLTLPEAGKGVADVASG